MFAELRLVAWQPARQETYAGKLALMMWQTFGIFAVGSGGRFRLEMCGKICSAASFLLPLRKRELPRAL